MANEEKKQELKKEELRSVTGGVSLPSELECLECGGIMKPDPVAIGPFTRYVCQNCHAVVDL